MSAISQTDLILNPDGSVYHLSLKPENISHTIIAVGDPNRVHQVSRHFDSIEFEMNKREFITHTGHYKGKRLTVISSGMGTDNVEILMTELDALVNIDLLTREPKEETTKLEIVRVGTSGSIQDDILPGAHLLSEYAIGLDPLISFYPVQQDTLEEQVSKALQKNLDLPYAPYCIRGSNRLRDRFADFPLMGNTLTCPGFYASQGRSIRTDIRYPHLAEELSRFHVEDFWITNMEMETAGYYAMARLLGHEMISLNAILANRIGKTFSAEPDRVIDSLIEKVLDRI